MGDPEIQKAMYELQMAPMKVMEKQPVKEECTEEKIIEILKFITKVWNECEAGNDMADNLVLHLSAFDKAYSVFQYDELQIGAAVAKYEASQN